jgi:D-beta-D-heptose 7-phosphate kinase / D-beta-D-heptose 1-phosphate adenosyltransferase
MNYLNVIDRFSTKKILVIGDCILDVYVKGVSTRLCPEAPVAVVDVTQNCSVLGGAANTACNLAALSADVTFCSVLGCDNAAEEVLDQLRSAGVNTVHVIKRPNRTTIVKTRVVSGDRVLIRYDEGTINSIDEVTEQMIMSSLQSDYAAYDAVIISDYSKGVITPKLLEFLQQLQETHRTFLVVDSKRLEFFSALQPDLVKPNYEEVIKILGLDRASQGRSEQIFPFADKLFEFTQSRLVAVTLDAEGSLIIENGRPVHRSIAPTVSYPYVSGAGDTYISSFTLGYLSSNSIETAAEIATAASTVAIGKDDTAACFVDELKCYFCRQQKFIHTIKYLEDICVAYHAEGKRIVFTNGCFDILHSGHVSYLNQARALGDILIVGVNNDESINRLKGPRRPINPLADRIDVLCALTAVTHVIPFGDAFDDTPIQLIKAVRPAIFVKGGDYTRGQLPEADTVDAVGGQIIFIPLIPDHSTSRIIERIHTQQPELI